MENESLITPNNENKEGNPPTIGLKISKLTNIRILRKIIIEAMEKTKDLNKITDMNEIAGINKITDIKKIPEYTSLFFSENRSIREIKKANSLIKLVGKMYDKEKKFASTINGIQKPIDHLPEKSFFQQKAYDGLLFLLMCLIHVGEYEQEILKTIEEKCQFQMKVADFDETVSRLLKARYNYGKFKVLDETDPARIQKATEEFKTFDENIESARRGVTALLFSEKSKKVNQAKELLAAFYFTDFFDNESAIMDVVRDSKYINVVEGLNFM